MALERANILYPRNGTTIDTGSGINVRLLDDVNGGTADATQTATAGHTEDNTSRVFTPATAGATTAVPPTTLVRRGWGLRVVEDMTPDDDTNCNAYLNSGTLSVQIEVTLTAAGGTGNLGGTVTTVFGASLWRYNPSTDAGVSIASGTASQGWSTVPATGDQGTYKTAAISISVGSGVEFSPGEILFLQIGITDAGTLPNPVSGTTTYTWTLRVDTDNTKVDFATNQSIHQTCVISSTITGDGAATQDGMEVAMEDFVTGDGVVSDARTTVASKTFDIIGDGIASHLKAAALERSTLGDGIPVMTRTVVAAKSFTVTGDGIVDKAIAAALTRTASGDGVISSAKLTVAAKSFDLTGAGVVTEVHPVQAYRSFALEGSGEVLTSGPNGSTITIPLDELPTGEGGPVTPIVFAVLD